MKRIDKRTVEYTDVEVVICEWHDGLMGEGLSQAQALARIEESVPEFGAVATALKDEGFRAQLLD